MRARGSNGVHPPDVPDREIWRRSRETDATPDDYARLLDLAAFADGRLDDDDTARIAALIAVDGGAAADVAAARTLAASAMAAADPTIIAWAEALIGRHRPRAELIPFPARRPAARHWHSAASWSGLAAAMVLAGWLGFHLGNGLSNSPVFFAPSDDVSSTNELLDAAAPLIVRDFSESS